MIINDHYPDAFLQLWNYKPEISPALFSGTDSKKDSGLHMLFPEEEKIIVEEIRSNGQTVIEER